MEAPRSARMLGSAVVTTRLSSVTMKSATETIARVQMLLRDVIGAPSGCSVPATGGVVSDYLLSAARKISEYSQLVKWSAGGRSKAPTAYAPAAWPPPAHPSTARTRR